MSAAPRGDLGQREAGPQPRRHTFGLPGDSTSLPAYLRAWHLWRAIRRDAVLTDDERLAQWDVIEVWLRRRIAERGPG